MPTNQKGKEEEVVLLVKVNILIVGLGLISAVFTYKLIYT